jgi:hypothetical protein
MQNLAKTLVLAPSDCIREFTLSPLTDRYVPSATHLAPLRQYPLTRHRRNRFASPSQLSSGSLKRCMYFFSCERMDTALDIARNDKAWALHHVEERPYLENALKAKNKFSVGLMVQGGRYRLKVSSDPSTNHQSLRKQGKRAGN